MGGAGGGAGKRKRGFWTKKAGIQQGQGRRRYNIIALGRMEGQFRIKTKLSYSPGKFRESVFKVRARIAKKSGHLPQTEIRSLLCDGKPCSSLSPHRHRQSASKLFHDAHHIRSQETFLVSDKTYKLSNTNESSSPSPHPDDCLQDHLHPFAAKHLRSMSASREGEGKRRTIHRTVSIAIDGHQEGVKQDKLMTTLSRLILGQEEHEEDVFIEFLEESSIHGEQGNFIEIDSALLNATISPA